MDGIWQLAVDLLSRFGVFSLLLIGMALIIRRLLAEAEKVATETAAKLTAQDEDHARDRQKWREDGEYLQQQIRELRGDLETERRARHLAEDSLRPTPGPAATLIPDPPWSRHRAPGA